MAGRQQYSSCLVDDLMVGIKVESVQEVTAGSELTPVPLASPLVSGLLNLRGHIVTAIDLRRCLELSDRPAGQRPVHLIMRTADGSVSLVVDQVGDVIEVDEDDFEAPPRTLRGRLRDLITGAYKLDGKLLLVLDTDSALAFSTSRT
jgi:purine-binding chemotaxis protein CheW